MNRKKTIDDRLFDFSSALDAESEKQVQSAINNVAKGKTIMIFPHDNLIIQVVQH